MANTYNLWFRQKYNLAPTDPRYLSATPAEIEAEYWAYFYQDNKVSEEYEDDDFDSEVEQSRIDAEAAAKREAAPIDPASVTDWEDVPDL